MHQPSTSPPGAKPIEPSAPKPAVALPRRRKSRRRRYILIGIGALLLLWLVGAIIAGEVPRVKAAVDAHAGLLLTGG